MGDILEVEKDVAFLTPSVARLQSCRVVAAHPTWLAARYFEKPSELIDTGAVPETLRNSRTRAPVESLVAFS